MPHQPATNGLRAGFTLIELSILLVIISLVIGGILVGNDLINAARIRRGLRQLDQFNAAVNTFQNKYNCLPGDCATASAYGFTGFNGYSPNGDGDGKIGDFAIAGDTHLEIYNFFKQLEDASLINDTIPLASYAPGVSNNYALFGTYTPGSPLVHAYYNSFQGTFIGGLMVGDNSTYNAIMDGTQNYSGHAFYMIPTFGTAIGTCVFPSDAAAVDTKLDDGLPYSGNVIAIDSFEIPIGGDVSRYGFTYASNGYSLTCTDASFNPARYYLHTTTVATCNLKIRANF